MKCPKCQTDNPDESRFCRKCGSSMERDIACRNCGSTHPPDSNFCNKCGSDLRTPEETPNTVDSAPKPPTPQSSDDENFPAASVFEGERKHVTILFSDLSGYTAMSEKLDPEEVKEIMSRIFGEVTQVILKYEGFIEKFIGDAVMAAFGVPTAHEDDPVRAIKATMEIHKLVEAISPELERKIGKPLSMHSGINTGLVVTGEIDLEKGTYGLTGDAINVASRLEGLAKEGEILVGPGT
jgi:class 3 adenylate cyclase/ribosomal protein L40E